MTRRTSPRQGFSLLELSVALGIISLVLIFGISLGSNAVKVAERISTQSRLATLKYALDSYATANGHLPCPADRALTTNLAAFGRGVCAPAPPGIVAIDTGTVLAAGTTEALIGGVPVRDLGLPDNYAADAWGSKLTYAVSALHINNVTSYATQDGTLTIRYGDRTGAGANVPYTITSRTTRVAGVPPTATIAPGPAATYVIVSHGPDKRGAFPIGTTTMANLCSGNGAPPPCATAALAGSCNDIENCDDGAIAGTATTGGLVFYDTAYNDGANPQQYFDDYLVWGSNALDRLPVVTPATAGGYDAPPSGTCPVGTCQAWCAPCATNYPSLPHTTFTNPTLCSKIVSSHSPCQAHCFWGGTALGEVARCP